MNVVDGSRGEGGGQILRTTLALAVTSRVPCRIENIRAGRPRPGLMRQHLACVGAAAALCGATVEGASPGSTTLTFVPGEGTSDALRIDVGSAGSTTLVLQTVLPPLLTAAGPTSVTFTGGTHNPWAPPVDFLRLAFLPLLERMGPRVRLTLDRPGFHPRGGGRIRAVVAPAPSLAPLELLERGEVRAVRARILLANLPSHVAEREERVLRRQLGLVSRDVVTEHLPGDTGPGNVIMVEIVTDALTEVVTAFGAKGVRAEEVAASVADETRAWLDANVPVGPHLADQLLVPMALGGGGCFRTTAPTLHTRTNAQLVAELTGRTVDVTDEGRGAWRLRVSPPTSSGSREPPAPPA